MMNLFEHIAKGGKVTLITHNDLDGAGCEMLCPMANEVFITGYKEIGDVLAKADKKSHLIIADINISQTMLPQLNRFQGLSVADHHRGTCDMSDTDMLPRGRHNVSDKRCGTSLLYDLLIVEGVISKSRRNDEWAEIINDYDMWINKDQRGMDMNTLFNIIRPRSSFIESMRVMRPDDVIKQYSDILEGYKQSMKDYIERTPYYMTKAWGHKVAVMFAEKHINLLGDAVCPPAEIGAVVNFRTHKVSLRSKSKDIDLSAIASSYGGGGHKSSAGFPLTNEAAKDMDIYNHIGEN